MSLRAHSLLRRICRVDGRKFSTASNVQEIQEEPLPLFRTAECNPVNHVKSHLNSFYTIPPETYKHLYQNSLPKEFKKQVETFAECSLLIREPAVEIISYLEQSDYTRPVNKYVLYGKFGAGKTITMMHLLHYAFRKQFILIHIPWANDWFRFPKEVSNSALIPEMLDLPVDAGIWLRHFKFQNLHLLTSLDLKISKDYTWTERDSTNQGAPLLELIDFGISRIKYACGVIDALIDELKMASIAGKVKTFVAIDGYNIFTTDITLIRDDKKAYVPPTRLSLTNAFLKCTESNWCNGAVLLSVDSRVMKTRRESDLPRYLLGKDGFEHLDPFVPVAVDNYTVDEFKTVMEYYKNRQWIRTISPEGEKEIETLCNRNPFYFMEYCKAL